MTTTLDVGATVQRRREITAADVAAFAGITGDNNPVHLDDAYARTTRFGGTIVHGMLVASLISTTLATDLPGPGTIYLGQTLRFLRPVRVGETVTVRLTVLELMPKDRVRLSTIVENDRGEVVVDGEATVMAPARGAS